MPIFADATDYLRGVKMAGNNSNLANVLNLIGVKCTVCMQSALKKAGSREARDNYYKAMRVTEEQIAKIEDALNSQ